MNAWKSSPWSIRCVVLAMVAYIVIAPTVILNGYLGPAVKEGFLLFMGVGKAGPTYAFQPEDCESVGKKATGWAVSRTYHGGINNGGITAAMEYECR